MSKGFHHYHKRIRNRKPPKSKDRFVNLFDKLIYFGGAMVPIVTFPQLAKIWIEQNATGVSLISWLAFLIAAAFWVIYGILHRAKPIIFVYSILLIIETLIVIGVLLYG